MYQKERRAMNNKKIFSVNMFWQTFKQLKVVGILSMAVTLFFVVFPQINDALYYLKHIKLYGEEQMDASAKMVYASNIDVLSITFILFTPILVLYVWNFLNKKNSSDFYHSLPYKRECLYFSKIAAVFAWQVIIHVVTYLCLIITFAVFKDCFIVEMWMVFRVFLSIFIANLLCGSAISLACALTGNVFSNICLSGLIIFLPRFLCIMIEAFATMKVPTVSDYQVFPLINDAHNIVAGYILRAFVQIDYNSLMFSVSSLVYTLILAFIYMGLGLLVFKFRKSEAAQKSALNKKLQVAISMTLGFVICFISVIFTFAEDEGDRDYIMLVVFFLVAAFVIIVYELATGKKNHLLQRSVPSILMAYVLSLIFGVLVGTVADGMLEYAPKAQSIDYIKINGMSDNQASMYGYRAANYFDSIIEGIQIKDKQSCEIVAKAIADNNSIIKNNKQYYKEFNSDNYVKMDIFVKDGLIGANRKVYIKSEDINVIATAAGKEEKYRERIKSLPIAEEAAIIWDSAYMDVKNSRRIYNIYKEEYYNMDYEKILNHMVTPNPLIQMSLTFNSKGKTYEAQLPITSQTPKAAQSYVEYTNEMCIQNNSSEMNQVKEILENLSAGHSVSLSKHESLSIDIVNASIEDNNVMESQNNTTVVGNQYNDTLIWDSSNQEIIDKCITALEEKNAKKQFNMNAPIYRITYTNYDKEDNNRMEYYVQ
jgi:ABC-2 type transport system permease protein